MNRTAKRNGFTLVEILIVVGIIVLVSAIFVPVILNLTDRNQVPKGASLLENALSLAKSRAVAEKRANGIRLIASQPGLRNTANNLGFAWYDEIQYIEDPQDYAEHWVWGVTGNNNAVVVQPFWAIFGDSNPAAPSPGVLPLGLDQITVVGGPFNFAPNSLMVNSSGTTNLIAEVFNRNQCLFGPISRFVGMNQWTANSGANYKSQRLQFDFHSQTPRGVQPGDSIEIHGVGEIFTVIRVTIQNQNIAVAPSANVFVPIIVLDRAIPSDIQVPLNGRPNYRVIRQPRVVPALEPVRLPRDVIIDLTPSRVPLLGAVVPPADTDINSGSIFMSGVSTGIGISNISGLTIPAGAPQQVAPLYVDIMFSPSGEVMPTSQTLGNTGTGPFGQFSVGASGLIALWVHQRGDPNLWAARQITAAQGNADNQALVAINTRTGFIGSYPINLKPGPSGVDPLYNARAGKERISADTGP